MLRSNRRRFLGQSAVALGMTHALYAAAQPARNEKTLRLGVIGVGWYGMVDAKAALKVGGVEIAAVCDVDSSHLAAAADELKQLQGTAPKTYKLYTDMLAQEKLDAVIIATPPHWHALQLIDAVKAGLDVYCEKPISYDVREGRAMVDTVAASDRVVQIGFQRRENEAFHDVKDFIASGKAGEIVQVDAQIHYRAGTVDPTPQAPPPELDWDLWCGPGPKLPYSPQVGHKHWRLEKEVGHGHLVDWGIHLIDATRMILDLSMPSRIVAAGGLYYLKGKITTPDTLTVHFEFDRCPVVWRHRLWGAEEYTPEVNNGIFFFGDKATIFATDKRWVVIPQRKNADRQEFTYNTDAQTLHLADFLEAVRTRRQPDCPILEGYKSTATVQLGMIAYESESPVVWDEKAEQIVDNPAAAALLKREYREGYHHPYRG